MRSIKDQVIDEIKMALFKAYPDSSPEITLDIPPKPEMGDFASNVALILAKQVKTKPFEVAQNLKKFLTEASSLISEVIIAGPGFINIKVNPSDWINALNLIATQKDSYGISDLYQGKKALVEFVSANPTGPLHIGHGRGAVVGDTLSRLLSAVGYDVTREYYVNDGGIQINTLGKSVYFRMRQLKGEDVAFPEKAYQGEYITDMARSLLPRQKEWEGWDEPRLIEFLGRYAGDVILDEIKADLKETGIVFDNYFFESTLYKDGLVDQVLSSLKMKGLSYESEGALWLKSTAFGDDKDRVLIKNDGSYTYLTPDIAYHKQKFERGFDLLVNIWGADHAGYGPRLVAAMTGLGFDPSSLHILFIQMVSLIKGGELLSMSTRKAQYETLESVRSSVGRDVTRYFFMMRSYQSQLDFDVELAKKQNSENPVYYVQYAHARICSIFSKAIEEKKFQGDWSIASKEVTQLLTLPEELYLCRTLLDYPEHIATAAKEFSPHRVTFYVLDLAQKFQSYYDKARGDDRYKVLVGSSDLIAARLYLLGAVRQVLKNALNILGVLAPEKM